MNINHQTSQSATGRRAPLRGHTLAPNTNLRDRKSETARLSSVLGFKQIPGSIWPVDTDNTEARLHSDRGPASILVEPTRTPRETRAIAIALNRNPLPSFAKKCLERRWKIGPDSVRSVLRQCGVDPGSEKGLLVPLTDALICEGIADPLCIWISASAGLRKILTADLLTLDDWLGQEPGSLPRDRTKYYRELSQGRLASIRIGKRHRFRPTLEAAQCWRASNA